MGRGSGNVTYVLDVVCWAPKGAREAFLKVVGHTQGSKLIAGRCLGSTWGYLGLQMGVF